MAALLITLALVSAAPAPRIKTGEPKGIAAYLRKSGHAVRWQPAPARERKADSIAGRLHWPKKKSGELDTLTVYDFGSAESANIQAESILALRPAAGWHAVFAGKWVYAGDPMRVEAVASAMRENGVKAAGVSSPKQ